MSQEAVRTLEQVRQRLNNLATQLSALRRDLETNEVLPSWLVSRTIAALPLMVTDVEPRVGLPYKILQISSPIIWHHCTRH